MPPPKSYTKEEVEQALINSKGFITVAARSLGCTARTVKNYMNEFPELWEIRQEAKSEIVDMAEFNLFKNIQEGKESSIIYALNQLARDRGYGKRLQPPDMEPPPVTPGESGTTKAIIKLDDDTEIEL